MRQFINIVEKTIDHSDGLVNYGEPEHLYHGSGRMSDIQKHGLLASSGLLHEAVFLTDNPQLAEDYAYSDYERGGGDEPCVVVIDVKKLNKDKLTGDVDHGHHNLSWLESLSAEDQCMYFGDISSDAIVNIIELDE